MDLLLRLFTPRKVVFAALVLGFGQLAFRGFPEVKRLYLAWRYPPLASDAGKAGAAGDILQETAHRQQLHVQGLASQADAALEAARTRGDDVRPLDIKRREAAAAASAGDFVKAGDLLNQIIAETPPAPTGMIPIGKEEADEEDIDEDLTGKKTNEFVDSGLAPVKAAKKGRRRKR